MRRTRTKRPAGPAPARRKEAGASARPAPAPAPARPREALLDLHRTAGNQAVGALIAGEMPAGAHRDPGAPPVAQRQDGDPPPSADPPTPAPDQQQTVRTVRIETDQGTQDNLTVAQAIAFLSDKTDWTSNRIE